MRNALFFPCALALALAGCGASSSGVPTSVDASETFSDTTNLVVNGAESADCTVTGEDGTERGGGTPDAVSYEIGSEDFVTVTCGAQAWFEGDTNLTLSFNGQKIHEEIQQGKTVEAKMGYTLRVP